MAIGIEILLLLHTLHTLGAVTCAVISGNWWYLLYEIVILSVITIVLVSLFNARKCQCKCSDEKNEAPVIPVRSQVRQHALPQPQKKKIVKTVQLTQTGNKARIQPKELENGRPPGILRNKAMRIEQIEPNKEDIDQIDRRRNRTRIDIEEPPPVSDRDNSPPLPRSVVSPDLSEGAIDVAFETVQEQVRLLYEELDSLYNTKYSPNCSIPKFPAVINDARNGYHVTDL
ncbi:hypothetical protein WR25_23290 [Diploscapter pachys]|uniref:Uncharacterized protein n=1 Tax=Diploscapter pachys TaxID=2018661 RepID=A0A2A2J761_9BILA|nr:hypothetical protein WR25_23290 [Diploscapter pachys]